MHPARILSKNQVTLTATSQSTTQDLAAKQGITDCTALQLFGLKYSHKVFGTEQCNGEVLQVTHLNKTSAVLLSKY